MQLANPDRQILEEYLLSAAYNRQEVIDVIGINTSAFSFPHTQTFFQRLIDKRTAVRCNVDLLTIFDDKALVDGLGGYRLSQFLPILEDNKFVPLPLIKEAYMRLYNDSQVRKVQQHIEAHGTAGLKELIIEPPCQTINTFGDDFLEFQGSYGRAQAKVINTSWTNFNNLTSMSRGDLVILGARPSVGKSGFSLALATQAAIAGNKVLFISLEMNKLSLMHRILASLTKVPSTSFRQGLVDLKIVPNIDLLHKNLTLHYAPSITSDEISRIVDGHDLVVVDYLQLLRDKVDKGAMEALRIAKISRNLKLLAGEKSCVVFAPAQLNRESEKQKRKPYLSDLRDSGSIEQDADIVAFLHAEDRYTPETELIIAKNRNGSLGEIIFGYNKPINTWREIAMPIE